MMWRKKIQEMGEQTRNPFVKHTVNLSYNNSDKKQPEQKEPKALSKEA